MTDYVRLCTSLADKGTLVPFNDGDLSDIYNRISLDKEAYVSIYQFNDSHKAIFKDKGSVAGITDVVCKKLVWDFDSEDDLGLAQKDAISLVNRLIDSGFPASSIRIFFSGNKGFDISVEILDQQLTPNQLKNICMSLAEGLTTADPVIYNATRILRLPLTKHQKSGLYKIPLSISELTDFTIDGIMELAKTTFEYSDIKDAWEVVNLPERIVELKNKTPTIVKTMKNKVPLSLDLSEVDWSIKPKFFTPEKYLISLGYFESGIRNHALMILASTLKNQGFNETHTYHFLKAAAELQSKRTGSDKFSKELIYNNIISQVFGPNWLGGTYSTADDPLLKSLSILIPESIKATSSKEVVTINEGFDSFISYAEDIDKNTLKFGIPQLDEKLQVQVGRLYGILGSPGSGKCHGKGTKILMFDGTIKNVEDVCVGDLLMGDDSSPRTVLSLARGRETLYKINQKNGDDYVINESHILSLKGSSATKDQYKYGQVFDIPLLEYLNKGVDFKKRVKGYKVPVEFSKKHLEIDPYILGVWIGDGTTSKPQFTIAKQDVELIEDIQGWADSKNLKANLKQYESGSDKVYTISITGENNIFRTFLKQKNLMNGKYIPNEYLTSNREDRLKLLAGLLDTDGYYDHKKGTYEFSQSNEKTTDQVLFLIRSLGFKATKSREMKHYKSFTRGKWYEGYSEAFRLYISGDNLNDIPNRVSRKKALAQDRQRYQDLTEIEVEKLEVGDYFGFELDGNHRYLLGDFTVTHNTSTAITMINNTSKMGEHSMFFSYDMSQFDVYQKLIQRHTRLNRNSLYEFFKNRDEQKKDQFRTILKDNYQKCSFVFKTGQTIEEIKNTIIEREKMLGVNIRLVIVDYLELVQSRFSDPTQSSMEAIQGLREIAINLNKAVVVMLQPSKALGSIDEPITSYNAAKGSSSIAQALTAMLTVHRPGYSSRTPENDRYFSIDCVKNRSGALFSCDLAWDGLTGTIRPLEAIEASELKDLRDSKNRAKMEDDSSF